MNHLPQNGVQKFSNSGARKAKAAATWLYLVAAATVLNSLILPSTLVSLTCWLDSQLRSTSMRSLLVCSWNREGRPGGTVRGPH